MDMNIVQMVPLLPDWVGWRVELCLRATLYAYESCDGDGGSLAFPWVKTFHGAGTVDDTIFSTAKISAKSLIDTMFVKLDGMSWFESERFWIDANRVGIFVIPNDRIFAPNFFKFKIIFTINIFENAVASKFLNFTFCCTMPQRSPVGENWYPYDVVEDVEYTQSGPGNMWEWDSGGSWWVHSNFVIRVPPEINTHFVTTFLTPEGEFPITKDQKIRVVSVFAWYELNLLNKHIIKTKFVLITYFFIVPVIYFWIHHCSKLAP